MWNYYDSDHESKCENQINMIPLIDIMLVLLVIFMIAMPIISETMVKSMQVNNQTTYDDNAKETAQITVCKTSELWLNGKPIDLLKLSEELKIMTKDVSIEMKICGETSFDSISTILDLISYSEHRNISFVRY